MDPFEDALERILLRFQCWRDERTEEFIYALRRKWTLVLYPPVKHEDECRIDIPNQKIHGDLAGHVTSGAKHLLHILLDKRSKHCLEVAMENGSSFRPQLEFPCIPEPVEMLEDRKAEPEEPLVTVAIGRGPRRRDRAKNFVKGADQQLVLIPKVGVEGRPADISPVKDLFDGD